MANFWQELKKAFVEEPHPKAIELERRIQEGKYKSEQIVEPIQEPKMSVSETNKLIDEIHNEFYTEVDRLLEFAKILKPVYTSKQDIIDRAERLEKLGFKNTKDSDLARKEKQRLNELKAENFKKQELKEAIDYFSNKYPLYKFITENSVKKICEKYNFIYGDVNRYIGDVPEKNLKEIENFKVDKEDLMFICNVKSDDRRTVSTYYCKYDEIVKIIENDYNNNPDKYKSPLEIVAPSKDFNMTNMEVKNFKLSKIEIPDPIVLQPVLYNRTKYYLIVTAWGQEASDPLVLNPKFN